MASTELSLDDRAVLQEFDRLMTLTSNARVHRLLKSISKRYLKDAAGEYYSLETVFGIYQSSNKETLKLPGTPNADLGVALPNTRTPETRTPQKEETITVLGTVLRHVDSGYVYGSGEFLSVNETVMNLFEDDVDSIWDPFNSKWRPGKWNCPWSKDPPTAQYVVFRCKSGASAIVAAYVIRSSNDHKERDPSRWYMQGSPDGGVNWYTLDHQEGITFEQRNEHKVFAISEQFQVPLTAFRLVIVAVQNEVTANSVQLRSIGLYENPLTSSK